MNPALNQLLARAARQPELNNAHNHSIYLPNHRPRQRLARLFGQAGTPGARSQ